MLRVTVRSQSRLPSVPFEGRTYKGVFGAKYDPVKAFMLRNNLQGPGWVSLTQTPPAVDDSNEANYLCFEPKEETHLKPSFKRELPFFSVLSIFVSRNPQGRLECFFLSRPLTPLIAAFVPEFVIKAELSSQMDSVNAFHFALVLGDFDKSRFDEEIEVMRCDSPSALMGYFAVLVQTLNPDVLLGHNLLAKELPLALEQMDQHHQSLLAKMRSKDIESATHQPVRLRLKKVFKGRLICDLFVLAHEHLREDSLRCALLTQAWTIYSKSTLGCACTAEASLHFRWFLFASKRSLWL